MIHTSPILRYLVSDDGSEMPLVESAVWAYAPDHHFSVALPDQVFGIYAASMIEAATEINAALKAEFDADMKAWLKMDEESRPEQPTLRSAELPVNGWVLLDGNWLVDGDPEDGHDIYNLPALKGYRFASIEEFDKASLAWDEMLQSQIAQGQQAEIKSRQSDWDTKADVYRKVGLTEGDIAVVLGERPESDAAASATKKGKR